MTVFAAAVFLWIGGEIFARYRGRGQERGPFDPTYVVMTAAFAATFLAGFRIARHDLGASISGGRAWPAVVGLAVLALGLALRAWSIVTLGRFFTYLVGVQEDHRVVEDGPYRLLRHPSYTGYLVAFAGFGLALDNWLALAVALVVPLAAVLIRIHREEALLVRELGEPYRSYMTRTRRLVPGVW
jgi:protein-S-isoprenylcysteine O-methyltransferase Ste14